MVGFIRDLNPPRRGSVTRQVPLTVGESSCSHNWLMLAASASSLCYKRSREIFVIISDLEANYSIQPQHLAKKKKKNLIMSRIFEMPRGVWLVSIPLLIQVDTPIAIYNSATRGDNRNDPVSLRRFRSHDDRLRGTQHHSLRPPLDQLSDTPSFNNLVAPAFLVGKVDFLSDPFLYDPSVFELSISLGSLDLDDRDPRDNDESAEHDGSRERHAHHIDDVNNQTDRPGDHDLPPSANTRSHLRQGSDGGSPPRGRRTERRSFNPYGPRKSTLEINNAIKDLLLRRHADADEGYVYGFQHPDDVAMDPLSISGDDNGSPHLIKIGRSKDHQARMRQISKKCGYVPHTVFAHHLPQHAMVERLVHTQLHNSRLRDVGCTGCGARHEEWFQVGVDRAEHLVVLWKAFAECRPYDAQGEMLQMWRERLEGLDLGDADCWEGFVHGVPLARPVVNSPQELQAETTPVRVVEGPSGPSSGGKSGRDDQDESWEVV